MKLTKIQIDQLYQFTRHHYVLHYDLQAELVDHMANAIETTWETQPDLSFEAARDQSFKTFGVFGFMDVVAQRQKAMSKRYIKMLWSFAKTWFTLPKLIQTIAIGLVAYVLFTLEFGKYIAIGLFSVLFLWMTLKAFKFNKYISKKEKPNQKLWLLEDLIFRNATANAMGFISLFVNTSNFITVFWKYSYSPIIASIVFTLFAIYTYVSVVVLPENAEKLLKNNYPEYTL